MKSKVFKVTCYSSCGTYFATYLQSVTVIATDEKDALLQVAKWLRKEGRSFIYPKDRWAVEVVSEELEGVIDYNEDSDY